jgi:hypothetical protein
VHFLLSNIRIAKQKVQQKQKNKKPDDEKPWRVLPPNHVLRTPMLAVPMSASGDCDFAICAMEHVRMDGTAYTIPGWDLSLKDDVSARMGDGTDYTIPTWDREDSVRTFFDWQQAQRIAAFTAKVSGEAVSKAACRSP